MFKSTMFWKSTIVATVVALILAAVPGTSVFAASAKSPQALREERQADQGLKSNWMTAVSDLGSEEALLTRLETSQKAWLKTNNSLSDQIHAAYVIDRFKKELATTEAFVAQHPGFSYGSTVMETKLASRSLKQLHEDLSQLRMTYHRAESLFG